MRSEHVSRDVRKAIRDVLLREWDSATASSDAWRNDAYDAGAFVDDLAFLLSGTPPNRNRIVDYLLHVERDWLLLASDPERAAAVADKLLGLPLFRVPCRLEMSRDREDGVHIGRDDGKSRLRNAIRDVLLRDWDPVDTAGNPYLSDEYDDYLDDLVLIISATPPDRKQIVDYLLHIERDWMNLLGDADRAGKVADKLILLHPGVRDQ